VPGEAGVAPSWYFGCSACGKCCDSAPRLLLPELFHHQARFVGCLGLRRRGFDVDLFVHAFSFASSAACPALASDRTCAIHDDRKPRVCAIVPLDASLPDDQQPALLATRQREARFWGTDCIRAEPADGFRQLTRRLHVVDPEAEAQLARHRRELAAERLYWGQATARLLGPELLDDPQRVRTIPEQGTLTLSLVPVLSVLAASSPRCHARVEVFVAEQNRLKAKLIEQALARRSTVDRSDTALLRRLLGSGQAFARLLGDQALQHRPSTRESPAALETWLGLN
jgi:hypothetical protein